MELLRRDQLNTLINENSGPCVSIFLPTARGGEETRQGPIRLKNLIKTAERKLSAHGLRAAEGRDMLEPAQRLCDNAGFWRHQGDGLSLFRSRDKFLYYCLPLRFEELAVVTNRFHVKPLLRLFTEDGRFYLLALSKRGTRFYECSRFGEREVALPEDVPASLNAMLKTTGLERHEVLHNVGASAKFHGHGQRGDDEKQSVREYLHLVEKGVREVLREDRIPLVLCGVDYMQAMYREASAYGALVEGGVSGSPYGRKPSELREDAWKVVERHFQAGRDAAAKRYQESAGAHLSSNVLERVVPAAHQGRVDLLFVAVGKQRWGSFDFEAQKVKIREAPHTGDQDLLDFAAIQTYLHGGAVYAVEPEQVPGGRDLAAVFRF